MTQGNGQKKNGSPDVVKKIASGDVPWFIRANDSVELVYRHDPAIKKFPKQDLDVAPLKLCTIKAGQTPAVFVTRPLKNREHLGLASISIRGLQESNLHEQYLAAAFEIAQMCVIEIRYGDGSVWDHDRWEKEIDGAHPGLVVGLGLWILGESTWDPTQAKKPRQSPQTLVS